MLSLSIWSWGSEGLSDMSKAARPLGTTETRFKDQLLSPAASFELPLLSGVAFRNGDLIPLVYKLKWSS